MESQAEIPLVIVAGPTGSGKSALALALAEEFAGTIINADSQQVYRDLAVLTARPGAAELARVPHRLYGVLDAGETCSAGRWCIMALQEIVAARAAGRLPILAGGTGLYLEVLLRGLAPLPEIAAKIREAARARYVQLGGEEFRTRLLAADPASQRLAPRDSQRLIRAWEVLTATGRPISEWQQRRSANPGLRAGAVVLLPPRSALYAACDERFQRMVAGGAEQELREFLARDLPSSAPAMKAVGVKQLASFLAGTSSREEAIAAAQQATRRYVKRQFTWFRNRLPENDRFRKLVLEAQFSESLLPEIFSFIRQFLLTLKT